MSSQRHFKNRIKSLQPLSERTTFKIGGLARAWYEPKDREELSHFLKENSGPGKLFIIGAGSNLLVKDGTVDKTFIHLCTSDFCGLKISGQVVNVGAGVRIGKLISELYSKDLGGYEFLAGIPGSIGGALAMNAGAKNDHDDSSSYRSMEDIVLSVDVLNKDGEALKLRRSEIDFFYRGSSLKSYVIVSAALNLCVADKNMVRQKIKNNLAVRIKCQDWRYPSAGSFFKNPAGSDPAGRLIDLCGLRGFSVGGARVSDKHANFIVNTGGAKSTEVLKLMEIVRKKVYNRFKINLEPEVEIVS